jgi:RHS repeat-associated protein
MQYKAIYKLLTAFGLAQVVVVAGYSQPANKPATTIQVPAPSGTVATTPAGYIVGGQSPLVNYVRERDAMGRITDTLVFASAGYVDVKQTTSFFDGLGRPLQTVQRQMTPGNSPVDLVSPVVYDAFGREAYKYMPYVATTGNSADGNLKQDPFTDQKNFYQNAYPAEQPAYTGEQVYYGQTNYEASPLNRVLKTLAPGNSWAGSDNGVAIQYLVNSLSDSVEIWNINNDPLTYAGNDITTNIPTGSGYYPAGQLYKTVTVDEQGHAVAEYKDMEGQVILKKVQVTTAAGDFSGYNGWLSTYYVYDKLNQLRFVLSPKATTIAYGNGWNLTTDTTTLNELCFRYEYDGRRRMTGKKVPGAGWLYMVYDKRDRLVFTQDANMRSRNQWLTTLYDGLNRSTGTGMINYTGTRDQLQAYVDANTGTGTGSTIAVSGNTPGGILPDLDLTGVQNGDKQATVGITLDNGFNSPDTVDFTGEIVAGGVTGNPFSDTLNVIDNPIPGSSNFIALTMTFYDDYTNTPDKHYTTAYNGLLDEGTNQHTETVPAVSDQQAVQTIGLVTGTKVRVIEDPSDLTKGNWLSTVSFYDDRVRVIQTQSDNYKGGQDTLLSRYNFTGLVIANYEAHANPQATLNNNTRIKTNLNYDHANRLLEVYKTINDADSTRRLIASHDYDQLGQVKEKHLGQLADQSFLETQDYSYNIRGWLKGINKDYTNNDNSHGANDRWFGMELSYDWGFGANQLNGNISGNKWRSKGDGQQRAYGFGYDDVNRLLFADFNQYTGSNWDKTAGIDFSSIMGNGSDPTTAYDENGNIKAMLQSGWQLGGSHPIDSLAYTYYNNSNKLQNVIDGRNDPLTTLGDFRTSSISPYNTGKTSSAIDYSYDVNGNMTRDLNKDIGSQTADGIIYNHLNLPWQVKVRSASGTKGMITYIYDATGNKLEKKTFDSAGGLQTITTYIGSFQYQGKQALSSGSTPADTLQFFGHEEGRVRVTTDTTGGQQLTAFKYDYFIKDHLGNTRMVLTDEQQSDKYLAATMETANAATEELYYSGLENTRTTLPPGYPADTTTNPNNYVARLNGGTAGPKIGPGIVLKVMAGDQFSVRASSWYRLNGSAPGTPANPLPDLLASLISGIGGLPGAGHPSPALLTANQAPISGNITQFLGDTGTTIVQTKPHAFVNWVLFDNQFNYVAASSGFQQVGADQEFKKHILTNLPITESGYLYIYTSNETPNIDVFFDNLQVTHTRGPLLEEDHYYPFGLTMQGISDKALKSNYAENKYRYNKGSELQNKEFSDGSGLELYETEFRSLDPQLGRWWQIDSKPTEAESPYSAMGNNPILNNDPLGDTLTPQLKALLLVSPNKDGDQMGRIRNATSEEYKENPLGAFGKDVFHFFAGLTGLNTADDESAKIRIEMDKGSVNTGDAILAVTNVTLALSRGEEGAIDVPGETNVQPYEVGMTKDLNERSVVGDDISIHHSIQGQPGSQLIPEYDYKNAPGIALPKAEHADIPTFRGTKTAGSPRQQLAKDIRDLRANTNAPNEKLQQLIDLNKMTYPEAFKK